MYVLRTLLWLGSNLPSCYTSETCYGELIECTEPQAACVIGSVGKYSIIFWREISEFCRKTQVFYRNFVESHAKGKINVRGCHETQHQALDSAKKVTHKVSFINFAFAIMTNVMAFQQYLTSQIEPPINRCLNATTESTTTANANDNILCRAAVFLPFKKYFHSC